MVMEKRKVTKLFSNKKCAFQRPMQISWWDHVVGIKLHGIDKQQRRKGVKERKKTGLLPKA